MNLLLTNLCKGEMPVDSKRIAFYLVLKFDEKPAERIRDLIDGEFQPCAAGTVFVKPVFGNMIQLAALDFSEYATSRGAKPLIFLRKANIEHQLKCSLPRGKTQ